MIFVLGFVLLLWSYTLYFNLCYKHCAPTELFVVFGELSLKPVLSVTGLDKKGEKYSDISACSNSSPSFFPDHNRRERACLLFAS